MADVMDQLIPIHIKNMKKNMPVYIKFPKNTGMESQWGIIDFDHKITIHKDYRIAISDSLRYFTLPEFVSNEIDQENLEQVGNIIHYKFHD